MLGRGARFGLAEVPGLGWQQPALRWCWCWCWGPCSVPCPRACWLTSMMSLMTGVHRDSW